MKIIRVFPRRTKMTPTDDYAFVGYPPMIRPKTDEVHVSCAFTWDREETIKLVHAWSQYYNSVRFGGCAFDDPCDGFTPGRYVRQGIIFTSRGCNNQCPWCLVPSREGKIREIEIQEGKIIQDNNFLQCNKSHRNKVFEMLKTQRQIEFSGGLDSRLMTDDIADQIRGLRIKQIFLACDTDAGLKPLEKAVKCLQMSRNKLRCYVLLAFDGETISHAEERLRIVYELGCLPFAQLYQPLGQMIEYSQEWKDLNRNWSRPAITKTMMEVILCNQETLKII
ncbi:MAG: hypothetical protein MUP81_06290 [Dehalococcoidia bacterium]|nr:hypothetical protein [Dehalococcoidia bacterium]